MPVVRRYIKGPMWIHFLVGVSAMYFSVPMFVFFLSPVWQK
jgi:hypothetical protein